VNGCGISPDNQLIASAGMDGTIRLWDSSTGQQMHTKEIYRSIEACTFTPDGKSLVYVDYDNFFNSWGFTDYDSHSYSRGLFENRSGFMHFCALSPDGERIVYPSYFQGLQIWDRRTGEVLVQLEGNPWEVSNCSFSPDGRNVLASGKSIWLWDAISGELINEYKGHLEHVRGCEFTPDGRLIFSVSKDKTLRVWEVATGKSIGLLSWAHPLKSLGLHPWKPQLVCGNDQGDLYVLKIEYLEYGPIIVTAVKLEAGLELMCPACQNRFQIEEVQLGRETKCPQEACSLPIKVNQFLIEYMSSSSDAQSN
jgi:WD40 repeat protein